MPRMRWTLDQKKHHVAAWRASGLTREQYCEQYCRVGSLTAAACHGLKLPL
ncbi:Uncharacterised protein [Escherichia coli]|nr:Uncharacterised protein [Escherichia coli]